MTSHHARSGVIAAAQRVGAGEAAFLGGEIGGNQRERGEAEQAESGHGPYSTRFLDLGQTVGALPIPRRLQLEQLRVQPAQRQQLLVGPLLHQLPALAAPGSGRPSARSRTGGRSAPPSALR